MPLLRHWSRILDFGKGEACHLIRTLSLPWPVKAFGEPILDVGHASQDPEFSVKFSVWIKLMLLLGFVESSVMRPIHIVQNVRRLAGYAMAIPHGFH